MLVNNTGEDLPATKLEARSNFASQAEAHRTPGKQTLSDEEAPILKDSSYRRQISSRGGDAENMFILSQEYGCRIGKHKWKDFEDDP
jgi:hypothetical protein